MQDTLPIFILIASELLDFSGAPRAEHHVGAAPDLSFPAETHPRAGSSLVPVTEDDLGEATDYFRTPVADPTNDMTADFILSHTQMAARATAALPMELVRDVEGSDQGHTAAAVKLRDTRPFPNKLLSSLSSPISTRGSQAATHPHRSGKAVTVTSPAGSGAGPPKPIPSAGVQQDAPELAAALSILGIQQREAPSLETSPLTSTVHFHPPRKETASPFPTREMVTNPVSAPPTSKRPRDASPQAQPDSRAAQPRGVGDKVTTSTFLPKPASGGPGAVPPGTTQTTAGQFSPILSLKRGTAGSEGRNFTTAVISGSGHTARLPALQDVLQGRAHSLSLPMPLEALGHGDLPHSPSQEPTNAADRPQPLPLPRTLNCTKHHSSQETHRSSQGSTALVLQRDADHQLTSKPENSRFPKKPQVSASASSVSQSQMSTLNLSRTTTETKGATSALPPGTSTLEHAALRAMSAPDSVHAALQPPHVSAPSAGSQFVGIPTSAGQGLHIPASPTSAHSGSLHPSSAQESQPSTTVLPELVGAAVSEGIPAHLAQLLVQQLGTSHHASTKNLSAIRIDPLNMLPSYPYLSFLLRNTDGMLCLLPMQDSPLPTQFPNISIGTLVSAQQILTVSNSSLLDLGDLPNLSLSSLILVKPIFILLPTDRQGSQGGPSPEGEDSHRAFLFTNQQGVNAVTAERSRDIPVVSTRSPRTAPRAPLTAGKPLSSPLPAVGPPDPPLPAQPPFAITGAVDQAQPSKEPALQGTSQGSGPAPSSARAQCTECLHSARTTNYPLRMSTNTVPLQSTPQIILSSEPLQRQASPAGLVPSTVPASPVSPSGSKGRGSAAGSTACPGAALHPKAAATPPTSISPHLTKHLELTSSVPKFSAVLETPVLTPVLSPFPSKVYMKTTTSGKQLAAVTHLRMYTRSPASPPSSVSMHAPLPSATKHDRSTQAQGNVGGDAKPTEVSTSARKTGLAGSSMPLPAAFNTGTEQRPAAVQGSEAALAPVQSVSAEAVTERHSSTGQRPGPPTTGSAVGLPLSTEEEEEVGPREVTEEAAEGSVTSLTPLGSRPGEPRRRSAVQPEGTVLSGVAVVSDELCGSGNYTVRMTLRPMADTSLGLQGSSPAQDSFLALVAVQSSLQPVLQVHSCCVTPSSSLQGPSAVCCPLPSVIFVQHPPALPPGGAHSPVAEQPTGGRPWLQ
ncbi:proline-rich protein 36-like [Numida meleagris]|uniref:proline-rich protein 36-like n=1 Tax=Numida meleagris TaxID=8996 RepID=UPI000B3DA39B|nr:proline-rich protein 36-like [Numida meleagris]